MATLPPLKTGAVMQYPVTRTLFHSNQIIHFLDGQEQRYRDFKAPLRKWEIRLELLDEGELTALDNFFLTQQGQSGSFSFVDPWDQTEYPDCSLEDGQFEVEFSGEMRGRAVITVRENRP